MNLGQRIKAAAGILTGLWPRWGGRGDTTWQLVLPGSRFDYATEAGPLWASPVVALGLRWLGERFTKPPIRVSRITRNGDYQPIPNHPMATLWNRPNAFQTRRVIEHAIGLSLVCDGNAYIHKRRAGATGRLVDLWWLPHNTVRPQWPEDGSVFIDGFEVEVDGFQRTLPPADVIHIRTGLDPLNSRIGYAPLKACLREVCSVNEEAGYVAAILRNAGVPGLMVVPDDPMLDQSREEAERLKEMIRDRVSGDNRGDAVVMRAKYKIEQIGFSPEQLALDKLPAMAIAKVAAAVGVPAMALGLPDPNKTYSNLEEATRQAWGTVSSIQDTIAEALRWSLLPEFGTDPATHTVEYDYTGIAELNEAQDLLHARVREDVKAGLVTVNEGRELLGFEPLTEGDGLTTGDGATAMPAAGNAAVQDTALNGAQVQALVDIVNQVAAGAIPLESAGAIIAASFPMLSEEEVRRIVGPLANFEPPAPEPTTDAGASKPAPGQTPSDAAE